VGAHSAKPEALQDLAERLSPGPRLELFARRRRAGWTCWGDQLPTAQVVQATGTEG
jgi:N6-adenosine-specific RNA methylase IME4